MIITVSDNRDFADFCECGKPAEPLTFMFQHMRNDETDRTVTTDPEPICADCVAVCDADHALGVIVLRVQVAG